MSHPLVSIIIPTFNRAHLINETLDSIVAQSFSNWECLIIDDGSTDNTEKIVTSYCNNDSRFKYFKRPKNREKGANACRNYGFKLSKGEYINWFDDDDLMHQDNLLLQVNILEKTDHNFSVCQTLVFENSIDNIIGLRSKKIFSQNNFKDYLIHNIVWMTPSAMWKRDFLNNFKYLFDEELQAAQEWEFHCRVLGFCEDYNVINKPLVYIRQHLNSITYKEENQQKRIWNYFLARNKIYFNTKIVRSEDVDKYLQEYLLTITKRYLINKQFKRSLKALFIYLLRDNKITLKVKLYAIIFIFSYCFFNKGYFLHKKIKYSK